MLAANLFVAILYVPSNRLFAVEVLVALAMTASTVAAAMLVVRKALGRAVISVFGTLQAMLLLVHMWGAGPGRQVTSGRGGQAWERCLSFFWPDSCHFC
ncbi:hypothetical protein BA895_19830 [Humibacillus sp. DSM 29435]|uniref:hypothetical protein n=1 Tax=Humibacillus sp. DSM 29435 TaxID=1869167 RepID=UPI000872B466|nr:hypothetical protein [Humibacillus sp. DSM 29435]OFE16141.1 hypothetical protein BA895_19830 [Humibacillus sp. DSM 29435]